MKKNYDLIFNRLYEDRRVDRTTLFMFWDILRCVDGEHSCIDENNSIALEIITELEKDAKRGKKEK